MKVFPRLYKLDSKGKVQVWEICVREIDVGLVDIVTTHGQQDGKMQIDQVHITKGKNIGKKNETTVLQQALNEAESKWKKQLDKGYREDISEIAAAKTYLPMLAKSYKDYAHKIVFPCFSQPKLDGVRCLTYLEDGQVVFQSRKGKRWVTLDHLKPVLKEIFTKFPNIMLDGELYVDKEKFQDLISAIKRDKPSEKSHLIEYHIYDLIQFDLPHIHYGQRKALIEIIFAFASSLEHKLKKVRTDTVFSAEYVMEAHKEYRRLGYEGGMLRNMLGPYEQDRRSENLQKVKEFIDDEFEIVGAEECIGKFEGMCTFTCKTKNDGIFKVMPEGTEDQRRQMYQDWLSGKIKPGDMLTVRFFEWTTSENPVPRFPNGVAIRSQYE